MFEGDPTLHQTALPEWWLCPPCRTALLGDAPAPAPTKRPLERAQLVWQRAVELVDPVEQHDRFAVALELLRTAHHDPTAMAHALNLGRTHLRDDADDTEARGGVNVLERAIAFLGVKPATDVMS
jgi:hypothetical protein